MKRPPDNVSGRKREVTVIFPKPEPDSVGGQIVAPFYDIESGAARYEKRGAGHVSDLDIPIPRDGGLLDLLQ